MADSKISALTALAETPASGDLLVLVDISDTTMAASGTNKKITFSNLTSTFLTSSTGLLATGATTGATSQAQTFTNGIIGPTWKPASNSTTALQMLNAGGTAMLTVDTSNSQIIINPTEAASKGLIIGNGSMPASTSVLIKNQNPSVVQRVVRTSGAFAVNATSFVAENSTGGLSATVAAYGVLGAMNTSPTAPTLTYMYLSSIPSPAFNNANLFLAASGYIGMGTNNTTPTAWVDVIAGTTAAASVRVREGSAPTSPNAGDIWNDGALSFYNADSTTNAVVNHLRLRRNSTGTAAAGFGLGIIAELESTTTDAQSAGRLTWAWETATHASRAAVGKLTAYYTSTEREIITFLADSAAGMVGINNTSPSYALDGLAPGGGAANIFRFGQTGVSNGFTVTSDGATLTYAMLTGNLGLGTTSPQAILHAHDGSGGFLFVNRTGVSSTLVTVIPDGAGDVTERLHMFGWVSNSAGGFVSQVNEVYLDVSSSTTKTDGSNTLTIAVTAAGAFTLQTTLGSATWKVLLWVFWR